MQLPPSAPVYFYFSSAQGPAQDYSHAEWHAP